MNRLLLVFIAVLAQLLSLQSARGRFLLENDSGPSPAPVVHRNNAVAQWLPIAIFSPIVLLFVLYFLFPWASLLSIPAGANLATMPENTVNIVPVLPPPELIITESDRFKFHDRIHDECCICLELNIDHSSTCSTDELSISVTETTQSSSDTTTPSNIELSSTSSMTEQSANSQLDTLTDYVTLSQSENPACPSCDETGLDSISKMPCGGHFIHKDCKLKWIRALAQNLVFSCPKCRGSSPTSMP